MRVAFYTACIMGSRKLIKVEPDIRFRELGQSFKKLFRYRTLIGEDVFAQQCLKTLGSSGSGR